MVPDPYKALGLPHEASQRQIKGSYRKLALQYHPDRLTRRKATPEETKEAVQKFASIASAYALLSDPQRKHQYDHIYKYGGYDEEPAPRPRHTVRSQPVNSNTQQYQQQRTSSQRTSQKNGAFPREKSTGIGYVVHDPLSVLFCRGGKAAAVAGIQIPSRMHISRPPPGGGLRFAFSSGEALHHPNGGKIFVSKTTQFVQGKKYSRIETTTIHPDGRKEVVIEGNDYVERHVSSLPRRHKKKQDVTPKKEDPWYIGAWHQVREKLTMCHNPCGTTGILAQ